MIRKVGFVCLAVAVVLAGMVCVASAAPDVASVSKRGSLLIFPSITVYPAGIETIVTIGNDGGSPVTLKCYWMDFEQNVSDFEFQLTSYQAVWFAASTGLGSGGFGVQGFGDNNHGELKCWAIDPTANPESLKPYNYLYGNAMVIGTGITVFPFAAEYNAWAFALHGIPSDPSGPLVLNGTTDYDACPAYLMYNFFANGAEPLASMQFSLSNLALSPCRQDVRQDRNPVCTKAKFDIWNENEVRFSGTYACVKCYFEQQLDTIQLFPWGQCDLPNCKPIGVFGERFDRSILRTDLGRFRVVPSAASACNGVFAQFGLDGKSVVDVCAGNQYLTPFVGVLLTDIGFGAPPVALSVISTTGSGGGTWSAGGSAQPIPSILWDAGPGAELASKM